MLGPGVECFETCGEWGVILSTLEEGAGAWEDLPKEINSKWVQSHM